MFGSARKGMWAQGARASVAYAETEAPGRTVRERQQTLVT